MEAASVDPRDQTLEVVAPDYRVCFWDGRASDEWELRGADVHEVIAWADVAARGRTHCLYAATQDATGLQLTRLAGWEGPFVKAPRPAHAVDVPSSR